MFSIFLDEPVKKSMKRIHHKSCKPCCPPWFNQDRRYRLAKKLSDEMKATWIGMAMAILIHVQVGILKSSNIDQAFYGKFYGIIMSR